MRAGMNRSSSAMLYRGALSGRPRRAARSQAVARVSAKACAARAA